MENILAIMAWFQTPAGVGVLAALLALSEALGSIAAVKANSIYQLVMQFLNWLVKKPGA